MSFKSASCWSIKRRCEGSSSPISHTHADGGRTLCSRLERCLKELNAEKIEVQLNTLNNEMEQTLQLLHRLSERYLASKKVFI